MWVASRPRARGPETITFIDILPASEFARLACGGHARLSSEAGARLLSRPAFRYFLPAPDLASASLQPSLRSAACDLMHDAMAPLPGFASPQSFLASALQALPTAATRMIAT